MISKTEGYIYTWSLVNNSIQEFHGFRQCGIFIFQTASGKTYRRVVYDKPGVLYNNALWLPEQDMNKAISLFIDGYQDILEQDKRMEARIKDHKKIFQKLTKMQKEANDQ